MLPTGFSSMYEFNVLIEKFKETEGVEVDIENSLVITESELLALNDKV